MKVFAVDECNTTWEEKVNFYIYGGIVIEEEEIKGLITDLIEVKRKYGIDRPLKWTNNKWNGRPPMDIELHKKAKEAVLKTFAASNSKIIVCISPQRFYHTLKVKEGKVYQSIDQDKQNRTHRYGIRDSLWNFNQLLKEKNEMGMIVADELSKASKEHLTQHCLALFRTASDLTHIIHPVIQLKNDDSYLNQINDVVLGSIYYSLSEAGYNSLPLIVRNFWGYSSSHTSILGKGLSVLPLVTHTIWCKQAKERIKEKFLRLAGV